MYAEKYVSGDIITNITKMVDDIRAVYRQRINNLSWMGAETKAAAIDKLDKMQVVVGYDRIFMYYITQIKTRVVFILIMFLQNQKHP